MAKVQIENEDPLISEEDEEEDEGNRARQNLEALNSIQFLIRKEGEKVKPEDLKGRVIGIYFSAHWCPPCSAFTPLLIEIYEKLGEKGDFEVVFVSSDEDESAFQEYFGNMPWLAVPFSDREAREKLDEIFAVDTIPHLAILGKDGTILTKEGVEIVQDFEEDAYPFTKERIVELKEQMEQAKANQSITSLLVSNKRDYLLNPQGTQVPVSELEGKSVGLYFSAHWCVPCRSFTPRLVEVYNELKSKGHPFEIVFCSGDRSENAFNEYYSTMPWLTLPYLDKTKKRLSNYFEVASIPTLVILGPDGKTVQTEAVDLIREYGAAAYPFTTERMNELEAEEIKRREHATLQSILVSDERNFVINQEGENILIANLAGKTVGLYFSAHWCPPCKSFTPKLVSIYNDLKGKGEAFEIVFISYDHDEKAFEEYYSTMPWLALPFDDKMKRDISKILQIRGIPTMIVAGPDGKFVSFDAVNAISIYGAEAYPFTENRIKAIRAEIEAQAEISPKEIQSKKHEHKLALTRREEFSCDECDEEGSLWSYYCKDCDFDLHLDCALKEETGLQHVHVSAASHEEEAEISKSSAAGMVCDGDVCRRAEEPTASHHSHS